MKTIPTFPLLTACALAACTSTEESAAAPAAAAAEPEVEAPEATSSGATASGATASEGTTPASSATPSSPAAPAVARAEIETLVYTTEIAAPVEEVWDTMLGPETYGEWTRPFMAGSYFEGTWAEGERMHFLAPGGSGMVALIEENRPHELVSIAHLGYVANGVEDTTSENVRRWAPAYERYRFASVSGGTRVTVEHEVFAAYAGLMNAVWPKALAELKALCEAE
jgi:uncharacterized protein YndB with AHSA1/START domain